MGSVNASPEFQIHWNIFGLLLFLAATQENAFMKNIIFKYSMVIGDKKLITKTTNNNIFRVEANLLDW